MKEPETFSEAVENLRKAWADFLKAVDDQYKIVEKIEKILKRLR